MGILKLHNNIITNNYFLSCPQIKAGLGSSVHKPRNQSNLYRRITVSPQLGCILDRFIDPATEGIFRTKQSPDQLGFTRGILMAAVQHVECQR